jgi:SAM-dependent methyltransferase
MTDKPAGLREEYAAAFLQESVASSYHHRPPYPRAVVDALLSLLEPWVPAGAASGGAVLEVGCGTGELSRDLVPEVGRVDAVDVSAPMIEQGRRLEHGDDTNLHWIEGRLEDVALDGPYDLALAADSLHWTDWRVALPKLRDSLAPRAWLALVGRGWGTGAAEETAILSRYSTNHDYQPYDLVQELEARGLYRQHDHLSFASSWTPTIEEYLEARHTQASLARELMGATAAADFDREVSDLLRELLAAGRLRQRDGRLQLRVVSILSWGRPQHASSD